MQMLCMFVLLALIAPAEAAPPQVSPRAVTFATQDGGIVYANVYGGGERGVVLAHGGQFNKESWEPQAQILVNAGFRVLAFDFRGYGESRGPHDSKSDEGRRFDVLAATAYLRTAGAKSVAVVGASMGGDYAAEAAEAEPDAIDRIVLLGSGSEIPIVRMKGPKLYILCRDDTEGDPKFPRLPGIRAQFEKSAGPKQLVLLDGSAHAQWIFSTAESDHLMREILKFLSAQPERGPGESARCLQGRIDVLRSGIRFVHGFLPETPIGRLAFPGYALLQRHCSAAATNPAFTGFK